MQTQAIITQLVFDHALRIRVKAEVAGGNTPASSAATTPDSASIAETASEGDDAETQTTAAASDGGAARKHKRTPSASSTSTKAPEKGAEEAAGKGGNLVGKLNNLVTTDLNNVVDGRDFLFISACFFGGLVRWGESRC